MSREIVVAIDGPGGAGKSTVSRLLAQALGYRYVDTGAMYRVIGVLAAERGIGLDDAARLAALCDQTEIDFVDRDGKPRVLAGERDFTEVIRTAEAAQHASRYSTVAAVRDHLVARQRAMGAAGGVVMEGRDIGTVVFPDAALKVFLDASAGERARRRAQELHGTVSATDIEKMARDIEERDTRDRTRAHSPLRAAEDALIIDTTASSIDAVVKELLSLARERQSGLARPS
ncbi:MAG TPA: (d)CMP kinase [Terriglobales bacterium]|nr:(d)CMP kinase [Terriglobales bacterium]